MYIQKTEITNIRSIRDFSMTFDNPAGWHVLIGDNGAGKSTIIRSMALALIGEAQIQGLRANWDDWLNKSAAAGSISLDLSGKHLIQIIKNLDRGMVFEKIFGLVKNKVTFSRPNGTPSLVIPSFHPIYRNEPESTEPFIYGEARNWTDEWWFSTAFGPYRRFEGGDSEWQKVFENPSYAKLAAHLSIFGEDVALTETIRWLVGLYNTSNDPIFPQEQVQSENLLKHLKKLLNSEDKDGGFLPHSTKLESVNSKSVVFIDGNGTTISVNQMSDGYRSILSMTFELIRQLVRVYGSELVFKNIEKGEMFIDLPGVVLVDEIDAHLHPTWQTRIGQWFTKYFPQLQFIVTTHSPLVCRACERGSIWRLAAPGSEEKSGEITGLDRERLIHGNILDAAGTGAFGDISISQDDNKKLNRLSQLNVKSMMGLITEDENQELQELRAIFPTRNKVKK